MWIRKDFVFSSARHAPTALVLLLSHTFPTTAQIPGFDMFTAPGSEGISIAAGSIYTIKWTPSSPAGQISIILLEGVSLATFQEGPTITHSIQSTAGSYAWQVPSTPLNFPYYAFKLYLESDPTQFQYSYPFSITGESASTTSENPVPTSTAAAMPPPSTSAIPSDLSSSSVSAISSDSSSSSASATSSYSSSSSTSAISSDLSSPSTLAASSNPSSSSTAPTLSPSTSTSPSPSPTASSETLTTAAKAGIGIGASLGGILVFALIAFTFFRYGKRAAIKSDTNAGTWEKAELGTGRPENVELPAGSSGVGIAELPGREREIAELEAGMKRSEGHGATAIEVEKRG